MAWAAHLIGRRVRVTARVRRGVAAVLAAGAAATGVAVVMAAGGPTSAYDELRDRFEAPIAGGQTLNDRLFSVSGNGRQETIRVAWDAGSEHPLAGTGAGTFEIVWYERRPSTQIVRDAHSLYVETFSELGLVGLALLGAAACSSRWSLQFARDARAMSLPRSAPTWRGLRRAVSTGTGRWSV